MNEAHRNIKIGLATLGCKVNQCDSAALASELEKAGFIVAPFNTPADAYIINTCTVTGFADFQARQLIRRARRNNPRARIIVTGCYAQIQPDIIASLDGVTLVVGNDQKNKIVNFLNHPLPRDHMIFVEDISQINHFQSSPVAGISGRTRAFFKMQDGCNAFCSYCIVPFARGKSRSLPVEEALSGIKQLVHQDFREIVLTGIHLGQYGLDLNPPIQLASILTMILSENPLARFRLSSIEPNEISQEMLQLFASHPNLCPHLHIPLQSGDDIILQKMNRTYDVLFYRSLLERVVETVPDIAIGIDIMTGFPGETETQFQNTVHLLSDLSAAYFHVFPYSERPGTAAYAMEPKIPEKVKKERAAVLRRLSSVKRETFSKKFIGRTLPVLVELARDKKTGLPKGFSHNYLPVILDKQPSSLVNIIANVKIEDYRDEKLTGRVLHE